MKLTHLGQMARRHAATLWPLTGLFLVFALTGCSETTQILAKDSHAFIPSLRAAVSISEDKQPASEPQTGRAIEISYTKVKGNDNQSLDADQDPVVLKGTTFTGPLQLKHDFEFEYADISYRWRKFFGERSMGLEVSGGIGHASLDLTTNSATQRATKHFDKYGPQGGVAFLWRMRPSTSLHARLSGFASHQVAGIRMVHYEAFLTQALGNHVELRAGYGKWYVQGDGKGWESDVRTIFSGPTLDLGLNF